jgi:hypothetical protein
MPTASSLLAPCDEAGIRGQREMVVDGPLPEVEPLRDHADDPPQGDTLVLQP